MCIIDGEIKQVAGTNLFVMPSEDKLRQLTVYSNKVDTSSSNIMCLPIPNPSTVTFETVYDDLFDDCLTSFCVARSMSSDDEDDAPTVKYLRVQSHGSYEVVLAPTLDDLDRVPPGFMKLSDDVKSYLRTHYSGQTVPFGVLLCKLRVGAVKYEPFAYSHAIMPSGDLFIPTRHYHVGDSSSSSSSRSVPVLGANGGAGAGASFCSPWLASMLRPRSKGPDTEKEFADDWDHAVYTLQTPQKVAHTSERPPGDVNRVKWNKMPVAYRHGSRYKMRLFERVGRGPNEDLTFPITAA